MSTSELVNTFVSAENSPLALSSINAAVTLEEYLPTDNSIFALAGLIADLGLELTDIIES